MSEARLQEPIKGNDRLEALRLLIVSEEATDDERKEFEIGLGLYDAESMGDKPWRDDRHSLYEERDKLQAANEATRAG